MDALRTHIAVVCLIVAGVVFGIIVGLRRLLSNWCAGVLLRIRHIRTGDIVEFRNGCAWVNAVGSVCIVLQTWDKCHHIIPYRDFLGGVFRSKSLSKQSFTVRIPVTRDDTHDGQRSPMPLADIATQINSVLAQSPALGVVETSDSRGVILRIPAWIKDPEDGLPRVKSQVLQGILDRLNAAGITVPIPVAPNWSLN